MSAAAAAAEPRVIDRFARLETRVLPSTLLAALHAQYTGLPGAVLAPFKLRFGWSQDVVEVAVTVEVFELSATDDPLCWNFAGRIIEVEPACGHYEPSSGWLTMYKGHSTEFVVRVPFQVGQFVNGQTDFGYDAAESSSMTALAIVEYDPEVVEQWERNHQLLLTLGHSQ